MKKLFLLICLLTVFILPAYSKTLKMTVVSQNNFSAQTDEKVSLKIDGNYKLTEERYIYSGTVIYGEIVSVVDPKIGKRDGYVYVKVTKIIGHDGKEYKVDNPNAVIKLSEYKPLDIKEKSIDVGTSAAGFVVKNISYPINFVRGVVTADEGENKISAGLDKAFDKSVFSYVKTGDELSAAAGTKLTVTLKYKIKNDDSDDEDNDEE